MEHAENLTELQKLLVFFSNQGGSDLFITAGRAATMKKNGQLISLTEDKLSADTATKLTHQIMNHDQLTTFQNTQESNFAYHISGIARYRVNVFMQRGTPGMVIRSVHTDIPSFEDLNLPSILKEVIMDKHGLVLIVGGTGSGKSTIIQLLLRFYDVTEGKILINSKNIQEYPLDELYKLMGYVPQKGILFSGDILSNMRIANPNATEEEILKTLSIAQIKDFALSSDEGLSKAIDQGGKNVSGGQKQRLSIARALVKNPPIYIFDDSFSALDYRTDKTLRGALKKEVKDSINIIVGQRIGTIMDADQIIVLDKGDMVCSGTHQELLAKNGMYKRLVEMQSFD